MANKHTFKLSVNTVGCQEDTVAVGSDSIQEAVLLAQLIFVAACQLRMVRGFDEFDKVTLERMIEDVSRNLSSHVAHWRISDTQVLFLSREQS